MKILILPIFCVLFSCLIVYPVWFFALHKPDIFSICVLATGIIGYGIFLFQKIRKQSKKYGSGA
ncbi:MAG: hypothetical protein R3Y36_03055 [Spirochaetales bacterium]